MKERMIIVGTDTTNLSKVMKHEKALNAIVQGEVFDDTDKRWYKVAALISLKGSTMTSEKAREIGEEVMKEGIARDAFMFMPMNSLDNWENANRGGFSAQALGELLRVTGAQKLFKKHMNPSDYARMSQMIGRTVH
jgi:hypothetical protein